MISRIFSMMTKIIAIMKLEIASIIYIFLVYFPKEIHYFVLPHGGTWTWDHVKSTDLES